MSIANDRQHNAAWLFKAGKLLLAIDDLRAEIVVALQAHPSQKQLISLAETDQDLADAQTLITVASSKVAQL